MKQLIFRSMYLQKSSIKWIIGYLVFAFLVVDEFISNNGLFFIIIPSMTYISYFISEQLENIYKTGTILNSMPVDRKSVVINKYLSIFILYFMNLFIGIAIFYIFKILNIISYNLENVSNGIIVSLSISIIIAGIGIPSILKFNAWLSKIINVLAFVIIMNIIIPIKNIIGLNALENKSRIFLIISVLIYISSFVLSLKIYKNKEF